MKMMRTATVILHDVWTMCAGPLAIAAILTHPEVILWICTIGDKVRIFALDWLARVARSG